MNKFTGTSPNWNIGLISCVAIVFLLLAVPGIQLQADNGNLSNPDDPLRPMVTSHRAKIYVELQPWEPIIIPLNSISPIGIGHQAKIKIESSIPEIASYYFFYRAEHPYAVASPANDEWRDTLRTLDVTDPTNNFIIDSAGGIGDPIHNYCYWTRAVDAVDPLDRSTWLFSAPSNVVCDWDYPLIATNGLTHWNQVSIPLSNRVTDTLGGWGERIGGDNLEIDQWMPASQSWAPRGIKIAGAWTMGRNRATRYGRPYNVNVSAAGNLSLWGDRMNDTCDNLYSNTSLTSLNNVVIQPAWHWFQDDSSSRYDALGQKLYNGDPSYDYGVREILEWSPASQSWSQRSMWNGSSWTPRSGVKCFKPLMLNRVLPNIPGGTAAITCWPPLVR